DLLLAPADLEVLPVALEIPELRARRGVGPDLRDQEVLELLVPVAEPADLGHVHCAVEGGGERGTGRHLESAVRPVALVLAGPVVTVDLVGHGADGPFEQRLVNALHTHVDLRWIESRLSAGGLCDAEKRQREERDGPETSDHQSASPSAMESWLSAGDGS